MNFEELSKALEDLSKEQKKSNQFLYLILQELKSNNEKLLQELRKLGEKK